MHHHALALKVVNGDDVVPSISVEEAIGDVAQEVVAEGLAHECVHVRVVVT